MTRNITLLELVTEVSRQIASETEVIATVASLVNSGQVCLCGNFRGTRFDLSQLGIEAIPTAT